MFWSTTPLAILSSIFLATSAAEIYLPGKISSAINLNESVRLTLPPINPLANAKNEAVDTFLTWVIGENTVLPIWPAALTDINALYNGMSYILVKYSSVPLTAFAISGVVYKPPDVPFGVVPPSNKGLFKSLDSTMAKSLLNSEVICRKLLVGIPAKRASSKDLKA